MKAETEPAPSEQEVAEVVQGAQRLKLQRRLRSAPQVTEAQLQGLGWLGWRRLQSARLFDCAGRHRAHVVLMQECGGGTDDVLSRWAELVQAAGDCCRPLAQQAPDDEHVVCAGGSRCSVVALGRRVVSSAAQASRASSSTLTAKLTG